MADRQITNVSKDLAGNITAVGVRGVWLESVATAINNIEWGRHTYYVNCPLRANVYVATSSGRTKYLKTTADSTTRNNLDNLPPL